MLVDESKSVERVSFYMGYALIHVFFFSFNGIQAFVARIMFSQVEN